MQIATKLVTSAAMNQDAIQLLCQADCADRRLFTGIEVRLCRRPRRDRGKQRALAKARAGIQSQHAGLNGPGCRLTGTRVRLEAGLLSFSGEPIPAVGVLIIRRYQMR